MPKRIYQHKLHTEETKKRIGDYDRLMVLRLHTKKQVEEEIENCEGNHIQQVIYSTYHKALTQICFGCGVIRTSLKKEDLK